MMERRIKNLSKRGAEADVMEALLLLTRAYIQECGISMGNRTVVYNAADAWQERLAWLDLPLSAIARKESFVKIMPYITDEYNPEEYDEYDIVGMDNDELLRCCSEIVHEKEFDEKTLEVMCWGILKCVTQRSFTPIAVEAKAPCGTPLKGLLTSQNLHGTYMTMLKPYNDLRIRVLGLERSPETLLIRGYLDYNDLLGKEAELRVLYSKYQLEFERSVVMGESKWKRWHLFDDVFGATIGNSTLAIPEYALSKLFGMKFYDMEEDA